MTADEALHALNTLRSNVIGTQSAGWSNLMYPFVAILNAAGIEQFDPTDEQMRQHLDCYGGAGGYPGHVLQEPDTTYCTPVGIIADLTRSSRKFLEDPSDENRAVLTYILERVDKR